MNRAGILKNNNNSIRNIVNYVSNRNIKIKIDNKIWYLNYENGNIIKFMYNKLILLNIVIIILLILNIWWLYLLLFTKKTYWYFLYIIINYLNFFSILLYQTTEYKYFKHKLIENSYKNYIKKIFLDDKFNLLFFVFLIFPLQNFEYIKFNLYDYVILNNLELNLNDIIFLLNTIKFYYLLVYLIKSSWFYNYRAERICKLFTNSLNVFFGFKCIYHNNIEIISILFLFYIILIFSYLLKIFSNNLVTLNGNENSLFINYLWINFISFSQIGYGYSFPKTLYERIIILFNSFIGFVFFSTILIGIIKNSDLVNRYKSIFFLIKKINIKNKLEEKNKLIVKYLFILNKIKNSLFSKKLIDKNDLNSFIYKNKLRFINEKILKIGNLNRNDIILNLDYTYRNIYIDIDELIHSFFKKGLFKKIKINIANIKNKEINSNSNNSYSWSSSNSFSINSSKFSLE